MEQHICKQKVVIVTGQEDTENKGSGVRKSIAIFFL